MARDFMLFFVARSGSSHLISLMDSHPAIVAKNEIFGKDMLPGKVPNTRLNQLSFLRKLWKRSLATEKPGKLAIGFKAQVNFWRPQIYDWVGLHKIINEARVKSIFLYRENTFDQVLSGHIGRVLKKDFGCAHSIIGNDNSLKENSINAIHIEIDIEEALMHARIIKMNNAAAFDYIRHFYGDAVNENFLRVAYETLISRPEETLEKVFQFLDVDPKKAQEAASKFRKISLNGYENNINNYEQLVKAMEENGFLAS